MKRFFDDAGNARRGDSSPTAASRRSSVMIDARIDDASFTIHARRAPRLGVRAKVESRLGNRGVTIFARSTIDGARRVRSRRSVSASACPTSRAG